MAAVVESSGTGLHSYYQSKVQQPLPRRRQLGV